MYLSISSQNRLMRVIVADYERKFKEALGMSARFGGFKGDMVGLYSRLVMWLKTNDTAFETWFTLTQEAGEMWIQWYDWYTRIDYRLERAS